MEYSGSVVKTKIWGFYNELIWLISYRKHWESSGTLPCYIYAKLHMAIALPNSNVVLPKVLHDIQEDISLMQFIRENSTITAILQCSFVQSFLSMSVDFRKHTHFWAEKNLPPWKRKIYTWCVLELAWRAEATQIPTRVDRYQIGTSK